MAWTSPGTVIAGQLMTAAYWNTEVRDNLLFLYSAAYPVGCIYTTTVATNPATVLGFGTWAAFGSGRVLVGVNAGDPDFDTVEETGGAKTVTLDVSQIPSHNHPGSTVAITDTHTHTVGHWHSDVAPGSGAPKSEMGGATNSSQATSGTSGGSITAAPTIAAQGGGGAHSNVQPYITVYMWKRTA